jgi:hypothetical protein
MSNKRTIVLRGSPEVNEYGIAQETIKPGYLTKGVSQISKATSTHRVGFNLALERSELGTGIDDAHRGVSTISAFYASGDQVKVGSFDAGDEAVVYVASGQNISEDDYLTSAGDGTFAETATVADFMCRALETLGVVTVETPVRVQVI